MVRYGKNPGFQYSNPQNYEQVEFAITWLEFYVFWVGYYRGDISMKIVHFANVTHQH